MTSHPVGKHGQLPPDVGAAAARGWHLPPAQSHGKTPIASSVLPGAPLTPVLSTFQSAVGSAANRLAQDLPRRSVEEEQRLESSWVLLGIWDLGSFLAL